MSSRVAQKQAARVVREQLARERRRRRTTVVSIVAAVALVAAGIVGYAVYASQRPEEGFRTPATATSDFAGLKVGSGPVVVELYLDYLCPACRQFEANAADTIKRYLDLGRITLVYHPVAILDHYSTNQYSSRSAAGAGCAADAGKLTEYTDALYNDQPAEGGPGHTDDRLVEIAALAGVPRDSFGQCLREGRYADWVLHSTDAMARRGVNGTPTVFVNGVQVAQPTVERLAAAIDTAAPKP